MDDEFGDFEGVSPSEASPSQPPPKSAEDDDFLAFEEVDTAGKGGAQIPAQCETGTASAAAAKHDGVRLDSPKAVPSPLSLAATPQLFPNSAGVSTASTPLPAHATPTEHAGSPGSPTPSVEFGDFSSNATAIGLRKSVPTGDEGISSSASSVEHLPLDDESNDFAEFVGAESGPPVAVADVTDSLVPQNPESHLIHDAPPTRVPEMAVSESVLSRSIAAPESVPDVAAALPDVVSPVAASVAETFGVHDDVHSANGLVDEADDDHFDDFAEAAVTVSGTPAATMPSDAAQALLLGKSAATDLSPQPPVLSPSGDIQPASFSTTSAVPRVSPVSPEPPIAAASIDSLSAVRTISPPPETIGLTTSNVCDSDEQRHDVSGGSTSTELPLSPPTALVAAERLSVEAPAASAAVDGLAGVVESSPALFEAGSESTSSSSSSPREALQSVQAAVAYSTTAADGDDSSSLGSAGLLDTGKDLEADSMPTDVVAAIGPGVPEVIASHASFPVTLSPHAPGRLAGGSIASNESGLLSDADAGQRVAPVNVDDDDEFDDFATVTPTPRFRDPALSRSSDAASPLPGTLHVSTGPTNGASGMLADPPNGIDAVQVAASDDAVSDDDEFDDFAAVATPGALADSSAGANIVVGGSLREEGGIYHERAASATSDAYAPSEPPVGVADVPTNLLDKGDGTPEAQSNIGGSFASQAVSVSLSPSASPTAVTTSLPITLIPHGTAAGASMPTSVVFGSTGDSTTEEGTFTSSVDAAARDLAGVATSPTGDVGTATASRVGHAVLTLVHLDSGESLGNHVPAASSHALPSPIASDTDSSLVPTMFTPAAHTDARFFSAPVPTTPGFVAAREPAAVDANEEDEFADFAPLSSEVLRTAEAEAEVEAAPSEHHIPSVSQLGYPSGAGPEPLHITEDASEPMTAPNTCIHRATPPSPAFESSRSGSSEEEFEFADEPLSRAQRQSPEGAPSPQSHSLLTDNGAEADVITAAEFAPSFSEDDLHTRVPVATGQEFAFGSDASDASKAQQALAFVEACAAKLRQVQRATVSTRDETQVIQFDILPPSALQRELAAKLEASKGSSLNLMSLVEAELRRLEKQAVKDGKHTQTLTVRLVDKITVGDQVASSIAFPDTLYPPATLSVQGDGLGNASEWSALVAALHATASAPVAAAAHSHAPKLASVFAPASAAALQELSMPRPIPIASNLGRRLKAAAAVRRQSNPTVTPVVSARTAVGESSVAHEQVPQQPYVPMTIPPAAGFPPLHSTLPSGASTRQPTSTQAASFAAFESPPHVTQPARNASLDAYEAVFGVPQYHAPTIATHAPAPTHHAAGDVFAATFTPATQASVPAARVSSAPPVAAMAFDAFVAAPLPAVVQSQQQAGTSVNAHAAVPVSDESSDLSASEVNAIADSIVAALTESLPDLSQLASGLVGWDI